MSTSSFKKISAAALAVVLGLSAVSHAAPLMSTGFETTDAPPYLPGNLSTQNGWTNATGDTETLPQVTTTGAISGSQSVTFTIPGNGSVPTTPATPGAPGSLYTEYTSSLFNYVTTPISSGFTASVSLNTNLGYSATPAGDLAGLEIVDNNTGAPIASFFVSNTENNGNHQDLSVFNAADNGIDKSAFPIDGTVGQGFVPAGDGNTGTYSINVDGTDGLFTVSEGGQSYTAQLGAFTAGDTLSVYLATIDQGTAGTATFDNLATSTPEPASIAMVSLGGLMLLAKRPKKRLA